MDQRKMHEIQVTWQLGLFIAAICALPLSLAPVFTAMTEERPVSPSVLNISGSIAAGLLIAMAIAVGSRLYQARKEQLPDGRPMSRWVLRQVVLGLLLCVVGAAIMIVLPLIGVPRKLAAVGCTMAGAPGVILIGRALAPAK